MYRQKGLIGYENADPIVDTRSHVSLPTADSLTTAEEEAVADDRGTRRKRVVRLNYGGYRRNRFPRMVST